VLQSDAVCYSELQFVAVRCSALRCNVLQYVVEEEEEERSIRDDKGV